MEIKCDGCGQLNPLGRVFCRACGAKLDLKRIDESDEKLRKEPLWITKHWRGLVALLVLLLLLYGAQAFWPRMDVLGEQGTQAGAQRLSGQLFAMRNVAKGRSLGLFVSEADLNAYLKFNKQSALRLKMFSADVQADVIHVRLVKELGPFKFQKYSVTFPLSYDLELQPAGRVLQLRRLQCGHLTIPGPFRVNMVRKLYDQFKEQKDWASFQHVTLIKAEDGRIHVEVKPGA